MSNRRQRIDSITAQVEVMQKSMLMIEPPAHVPLIEADHPFWQSILAEKPKAEWTATDLEIAALLAKSLRKLRDEDALIDTEGSILTNAGGTPMQNPRCRVVADLHARAMKYRQTLGIHSRGKDGEKRDVDKRRAQAFGVERDNPLSDDLLARPTVQ